jgi:4-nitrophenyl phosphatase
MEFTSPSRKISALILDLDGVIWRGNEPIGDLPSVFRRIQEASLAVSFVTNNSTLTVSDYLTKLENFGVSVEPWQVVTSGEATATYLKNFLPAGSSVFVIGEGGLEETLRAHGFVVAREDARAVVVGLDREFAYHKLAVALSLVNHGAALVGTNPDPTLPQPGGPVPGAGAILASVEAATGKQATIIGKPSAEMFNQALDRLGIHPHEALVVGDRLDTDIAGGQASGCPTAVVLTGATSAEQASQWEPVPDFISPDLSSLVEKITSFPP